MTHLAERYLETFDVNPTAGLVLAAAPDGPLAFGLLDELRAFLVASSRAQRQVSVAL